MTEVEKQPVQFFGMVLKHREREFLVRGEIPDDDLVVLLDQAREPVDDLGVYIVVVGVSEIVGDDGGRSLGRADGVERDFGWQRR